jgi:GNAT superfamily N-acetyltransferase
MPTPLDELPIRPLTLRDLPFCVAVTVDRGWPPDEHKWRLLLTAGTGYGIDDPSGAGLAGVVVLTRYGMSDTGHAPELSVVGMLLVASRHERRGLGQRLMEHVLNEVAGAPLVLYATPFGRTLYERLGFSTVGQNVTLNGHLRTTAPPIDRSTYDVTVRTATADDLPALIGLDTKVFGVDRTLMITRLPAFADQLRVALDGSTVIGYGATWSSASTDVVGPLIARDTATATALITSLAGSTRRPLRADIDARHEELLSRLKEQGLDVVRTSPVMVHGVTRVPWDAERWIGPLSMATC